MTFTIHASKDGQNSETQRIRPFAAAAKARDLAVAGWDVHVTDNTGQRLTFAELDRFANVDQQTFGTHYVGASEAECVAKPRS
jgi:hypothetical protein